MLLPAYPQPRLRHQVAEGQRRGQLLRLSQQMRLTSACITSSVVWSPTR